MVAVDAPLNEQAQCGPGATAYNPPMSAAFTLPLLANDRFLRACLRLPTDATPVWLMRQAGRYLPEYRATRDVAGSFMGLATNPELACEVTLQPLRRFDLDAAILFSDILTVPDAMGLGLSFATGEGPKFAKVVRDEAAVAELAVPDMDKLRYVFDAVGTIRKALSDDQGVGKVPLIGFSGSPWTLACYMVEGGGSDDYRAIKTLMYQRPDLMHRILAVNADAVALYLNTQIEAGAQAAMIFDSWGGVLADGAFQQFSLAYTQRVLAQLKKTHEGYRIPHIVFTKGGGIWLDEIADSGCDVVGLDWTMNLGQARARVGNRVALQGNLDPNVLFASPEQVREQVIQTLDSFGKPSATSGHIFNLGHGISQFTPPESVSVLVDTVHTHSRMQRT
jgi:uroporphyrinogen decarboxylase